MPKVDHLGYAVSNLDGKKDVMEDLLGFRFLERKVYERPGNTARLDFYEAEGAVMELVEMSNPDAPLNRFIAARGEGLHHICFVVEDLRATMAEWEAKGVEFTLAPTYGFARRRHRLHERRHHGRPRDRAGAVRPRGGGNSRLGAEVGPRPGFMRARRACRQGGFKESGSARSEPSCGKNFSPRRALHTAGNRMPDKRKGV